MAVLLTACTPSQNQIQTAIAQTEAAQDAANLVLQQTMVAQTQAAQSAVDLAQKQTQQAIELTQGAQSSSLPMELQIQTAIVQTQSAEGLTRQETQAALDLTMTPTPPEQATASFDAADAQVYTIGYLPGDIFFFTIQFSEEVKGEYHAEMANRKFKCSVLPQYPNRLYCQGASRPPVTGLHWLQLYEDVGGGANIVFAQNIDIPYPVMTPTRVPTFTPTPG